MLKRRGFTLIELMVVMGIISILAALLLPVINRVRQMAMQTHCLSNMRQITAACLNYAMDGEGQLPYCNWGDPGNTGVYGHGWMFSSVQYRTTYPTGSDLNGSWNWASMPKDGVMTGVIWPYLKTLSVYHCPLSIPEFWVGTNFLSDYLCNGAQCGYGYNSSVAAPTNSTGGFKLGAFKANSNAVYFWESMEQRYENQSLTGAVWNDGASYPFEEVLADRHFKGANVACFDGHVEWWDPNTWKKEESASGPSRLWCSPKPGGNGH